jgi:hypothetical protein
LGFARDPIHEGIGCFQGLEFADVRLCCYRLLLPALGSILRLRSGLSPRDRGPEMERRRRRVGRGQEADQRSRRAAIANAKKYALSDSPVDS